MVNQIIPSESLSFIQLLRYLDRTSLDGAFPHMPNELQTDQTSCIHFARDENFERLRRHIVKGDYLNTRTLA